jgi:hypothetical protein
MSRNPIFRVALRGDSILTSPRFNKGTAFTPAERSAFGLIGRLPYRVNTLEEQCRRAYDQLQSRESPIRKNSFLQSLKDQNWVLYYSLILQNLKELIPIIYTPTEVRLLDLIDCETQDSCEVYRPKLYPIIPIYFAVAKGCILPFPTRIERRRISWSRQRAETWI